MKITRFKATWLENFILNNLPACGEVQIMTFSRSKLSPKLKGRKRPPWKPSWATFLFFAISSFSFRCTWSMIDRKKWGVYTIYNWFAWISKFLHESIFLCYIFLLCVFDHAQESCDWCVKLAIFLGMHYIRLNHVHPSFYHLENSLGMRINAS